MAITMDGIFINGQKATFHPEDILTGDASAYTQEIGTVVEAWLKDNVTGGERVTDTTLTLPGVPADAEVTGDEIGSLKEELFEKRVNGYAYLMLGGLTADSILESSDGQIRAGTGSGNNFVFAKYISIPKGKIYLSLNTGYTGNVVLYGKDKQVVDTIADDGQMISLTGYEYNNTAATYLRVGCYHTGGPDVDNSWCFAYGYDADVRRDDGALVEPLYSNCSINTSTGVRTASANYLTSDFIYADKPLHIYSTDRTVVKTGIHLYNGSKTFIKTYYANDSNSVSVPSGHYIRIYAAAVSGGIRPTRDFLNLIKVERKNDNAGFMSFAYGNANITANNERVGTIDAQYSEVDKMLYCEDHATYSYNVAYYSGPNNNSPIFMAYADASSDYFLIPKGTWYRYCVGKSSGTAIDAFGKVKVIDIPASRPETRAAVSAIGKSRMQTSIDEIPAYYDSHLATKLNAIRTLKDSCPLQFIFVTDYHFGTYNNTHNARGLLSKVIMDTSIEVVFNGGDTWTSGTQPITYDVAKSRLIKGIDETMPNAPCDFFFVYGNHDTGYDYLKSGSETITLGPYFTTDEFQRIMGGNMTGYNVVYDVNARKLAYYVDIGDFRIIVTNPGMTNVGAGESPYLMYMFTIQALLSMGNKTGVLITHEYYSSKGAIASVAQNIGNIIAAYNARATYQYGTGQTANFAGCTGEIACWIAGHLHEDTSTTLTDGTPVIITTTCNAGGEVGSLTRTVGTVNENAFDVFSIDTTSKKVYATRIGAGSDRVFSY